MRIYLDYNATSPPAVEVIEAMAACLRDDFGNPSSVHAFGQRAKAALDDARAATAALIGADSSEVVLTAGGTEANNLAIRGGFEARRTAGRPRIVTTGIEHEAVLKTAQALTTHGADVVVIPATREGVIDASAIVAAIDDKTAIVSVMLANNEIGTIQPVSRISEACRACGALLHTDAVQAVGKIPVSVKALGADLLSLSAHKFAGPKGAGALWLRRGVRLTAQMTGGRQERNRRAGTENVPALVGMGVAARKAMSSLEADGARLALLRDRLESSVLATIAGTAVNGAGSPRVPNTTNISFEGIEAESLLIALDLEGVAVSTGSACSSGSLEPSHVLRAMGLPNSRARNSLRFSLGSATTEADIDFVTGVLPGLVTRLRRLGRPMEALG